MRPLEFVLIAWACLGAVSLLVSLFALLTPRRRGLVAPVAAIVIGGLIIATGVPLAQAIVAADVDVQRDAFMDVSAERQREHRRSLLLFVAPAGGVPSALGAAALFLRRRRARAVSRAGGRP